MTQSGHLSHFTSMTAPSSFTMSTLQSLKVQFGRVRGQLMYARYTDFSDNFPDNTTEPATSSSVAGGETSIDPDEAFELLPMRMPRIWWSSVPLAKCLTAIRQMQEQETEDGKDKAEEDGQPFAGTGYGKVAFDSRFGQKRDRQIDSDGEDVAGTFIRLPSEFVPVSFMTVYHSANWWLINMHTDSLAYTPKRGKRLGDVPPLEPLEHKLLKESTILHLTPDIEITLAISTISDKLSAECSLLNRRYQNSVWLDSSVSKDTTTFVLRDLASDFVSHSHVLKPWTGHPDSSAKRELSNYTKLRQCPYSSKQCPRLVDDSFVPEGSQVQMIQEAAATLVCVQVPDRLTIRRLLDESSDGLHPKLFTSIAIQLIDILLAAEMADLVCDYTNLDSFAFRQISRHECHLTCVNMQFFHPHTMPRDIVLENLPSDLLELPFESWSDRHLKPAARKHYKGRHGNFTASSWCIGLLCLQIFQRCNPVKYNLDDERSHREEDYYDTFIPAAIAEVEQMADGPPWLHKLLRLTIGQLKPDCRASLKGLLELVLEDSPDTRRHAHDHQICRQQSEARKPQQPTPAPAKHKRTTTKAIQPAKSPSTADWMPDSPDSNGEHPSKRNRVASVADDIVFGWVQPEPRASRTAPTRSSTGRGDGARLSSARRDSGVSAVVSKSKTCSQPKTRSRIEPSGDGQDQEEDEEDDGDGEDNDEDGDRGGSTTKGPSTAREASLADVFSHDARSTKGLL